MSLLFSNIDQATLAQLQSLIVDQVPESQNLDYKESAPDTGRLCQLLTAFANTRGGCVIVGMREGDHGIAQELCGVEDDIDELIRRVEQSAANTIRPQILLRFQTIETGENRKALLIATPQSRSGPHMWSAGDHRRIYTRLDRSNTLMDIDQIRQSVLYSQSAEESALFDHQMRLEKNRLCKANEYSLTLTCHLPNGTGEIFDPSDDTVRQAVVNAAPHLNSGREQRVFFDGLNLARGSNGDAHSLTRNGIYQITEYTEQEHTCPNGQYGLPSVHIRREIYAWIRKSHGIYNTLGHRGVVHSCLSVSGCNEKLLITGNYGHDFTLIPNTSGSLTMPVITLDTDIEDWRPYTNIWLTRLWNAAGLPNCQDNNEIVNFPEE